MPPRIGLRDLGDLLGSAVLAGVLFGGGAVALGVAIESAIYDGAVFEDLIKGFAGSLIMVALVAGLITFSSVAIFGTMAALWSTVSVQAAWHRL